jgi:hypothetical protein
MWAPSPAQVAELERRLPGWLARQNRRPWVNVRYFRQYVGVAHGGRRYIYLNAFPADSVRDNVRLFAELKAKNHPAASAMPSYLSDANYWREHAIVVCDGGGVYWGVEYDPVTHEFSKFQRERHWIGLAGRGRANFGVKLSAGWCPARRPSRLQHRQRHGVTPAAHRSRQVSR